MTPMAVELRSLLRGAGETRAFGRHLGSLLEPGDWVALTGDLGSGKTTLIAGILEGLRPDAHVRSPTYVLVEVYPGDPPVVHADLYRLRGVGELPALALDEVAGPDPIVLVEWADRAGSSLPADRLDLELRYLEGSARELRIRPRGERWEPVARAGRLDRERWHDALYPGD